MYRICSSIKNYVVTLDLFTLQPEYILALMKLKRKRSVLNLMHVLYLRG